MAQQQQDLTVLWTDVERVTSEMAEAVQAVSVCATPHTTTRTQEQLPCLSAEAAACMSCLAVQPPHTAHPSTGHQ